ncbi:uncharacterized protein LOC109726542 [Ananas comosus]|uniref:Uncharacterized protein LOC109726542 n=1 Tax=Ananas comosus TaxID=4615 RepID=A0A6P5GSV2_ANACO|nr:uncharacterized protein LOC109726542 [Ananas comosus]
MYRKSYFFYYNSVMKRGTLKAVLVAAAVVVVVAAVQASAGLSPEACKAERTAGINACKPVMYGQPPSLQCCQCLRGAHEECVCPLITPKLAALIDVGRAVRIVESCGRQVPRNYKCGSITTP